MSQRRLSTLALALAGALLATTVSVPAAFASDNAAGVQPSVTQSAAAVRPNQDVANTSLSVWPESTALAPGQSLSLQAAYDTGMPVGSEVTWNTSDGSVATVDQNGLVTAVGPGEVAIRVTDKKDESVEAVAWINVRSVSDATGIELSESSITRIPGQKVFVNALLASSLQNGQVTWSVEPASLGTITADANGHAATLLTSNQVGSGTLKATVTTPAGKTKTVSAPLNVVAKPDASDDFIINDSGVLTGYRGTDRDVVIPESVTEIGGRVFGGRDLDSVWVPASVTTLQEEAFKGASLKTITFQDDDAHPSQLTWIGIQAFSESTLETLTLPRSVTDIDTYAFSYMDNLTKVRLGPNVSSKRLADSFVRSPRLASIEVDSANATYASIDGVVYTKDRTTLAVYPSGKNAGAAFAVPAGTTTIGEAAFATSRLASLTLPDSLRSVESRAFEYSEVTSLALPGTFEKIGERAFWYMPKLTRVDLGGTVEVSDSAFYNDGALSEVNLRPDLNRLTKIGDNAFEWTSPRTVTLPDSVKSIGAESFARNQALTDFHLGASIKSIGDFALWEDNSLAALSVSPANPKFSVDKGVLYQKIANGRRLVLSVPTNSVSEFIVPEGVTEIGASAFYNNKALKRVVLPDGAKTIGYGAFEGCASLTDLVIPDSLQVSEGIIDTGLDTVEYGTQIRSVEMKSDGLRMARHIVVRGGVNGSFYTEGAASNGPAESAFFGEGMTKIEFMTEAPRVLVLPSTLKELVLEKFPSGERSKNTEIYVAAAKGSRAWKVAKAAMAEAGIDASHLHVYKPAKLTLSGSGISAAGDGYVLNAAVGKPTSVKASVTGGLSTGREMRVVQLAKNGAETVLQDWTAMPNASQGDSTSLSYTWTPASRKVSLRIDVRDESRLLRSTTLTVKAASAPNPKTGQWKWGAGGWWYRYSDGSYPKGTKVVIDGRTYRFAADGYMRTGWVAEEGSWYYHDASGAQATGWAKVGSSWYYLDASSGAMATGWVRVGSSWYYLDASSGAMATGWLKDGDSWYYLDSSSGAMATGTVQIGSRSYRFDESGRWIG